MEYRVNYRDLPWSVAIAVLPGKMIGTFIIKPYNSFKHSWQDILLKFCRAALVVVLVVVVFYVIFDLTDGVIFDWLKDLKNQLASWLTEDSSEVLDTAKEL